MRLAYLAMLAVVGLTGCETSRPAVGIAPKPGQPINGDPASTTPLSAEERTEAIKVYTAKCARCHKFYDPAAYSDVEWRSWMTKMNRKARLKPDQAQLVSRYLETFRTEK